MRGERYIQAHRRHIAVLEQHGRDCTQARRVLTQSEEVQAMYIARRDQLRLDVSMAETPSAYKARPRQLARYIGDMDALMLELRLAQAKEDVVSTAQIIEQLRKRVAALERLGDDCAVERETLAYFVQVEAVRSL